MQTKLFSEPHTIIEKTVEWQEFINFILLNGFSIFRVLGPWNPYAGYYSINHNAEVSNLIFEPKTNKLWERVPNGIEYLGQFNNNISYGHGTFYLKKQVFDTVETGETECGIDGWEIPILKQLKTYKLITQRVQVLDIRKY